jgi:hypothetical protein
LDGQEYYDHHGQIRVWRWFQEIKYPRASSSGIVESVEGVGRACGSMQSMPCTVLIVLLAFLLGCPDFHYRVLGKKIKKLHLNTLMLQLTLFPAHHLLNVCM